MRAFLFNAHNERGGAHMVYKLGSILEKHFGVECLAVTSSTQYSGNTMYEYPSRYPSIFNDELQDSVEPDDLLICPASIRKLFRFASWMQKAYVRPAF